jgi:cell division protein FtsW
LVSAVCVLLAIPFLLLQPDIGMAVIVTSTWVAQLFISGLSVVMISLFLLASAVAVFGLYIMLPHVSDRIDKFFMKDGQDTDVYQVQKSIEAFRSGGFFGKGPGEGVIKTMVPDAHSDFVFSVIAEEFGFIMCSIIILLFIIFIVRSMIRSLNSSSIFNLSATFGILFQIGMQVLINVATSLNLMPTKGMTMPFISYGGCSMLASAISIGIVLAITKRKPIAWQETSRFN